MDQLPARFNPTELARSGRAAQITLPVSHFPRFSATLADDSGDVVINATFGWTDDRMPMATGLQTSTVKLTCQRCQKTLVRELSSRFSLVFIATEADAEELADAIDPVVMNDSDDIHVVDFIEDELILQLPVRVVHENETECDPEILAALEGGEVQVDDSGATTKTHNPFAGLDDLLKK